MVKSSLKRNKRQRRKYGTKKQVVNLHAGDLIFGSGALSIKTLLGSCISIVLWHPRKKISGICHFSYPEKPNLSVDERADAHYCDKCIEIFKAEAIKTHTLLSEYQAKIYGGGHQLLSTERPFFESTDNHSALHLIPQKNIEAAQRYLREEGVEISELDVGGIGYRRLRFDTASGKVECRFVNRSNDSSLVKFNQ